MKLKASNSNSLLPWDKYFLHSVELFERKPASPEKLGYCLPATDKRKKRCISYRNKEELFHENLRANFGEHLYEYIDPDVSFFLIFQKITIKNYNSCSTFCLMAQDV
jgi:hypothetical protein